MKKQILLMGKDGEYLIAKKNKSRNKLISSSEKVFAREVVPYGFDFTFGGTFEDKDYETAGYDHPIYRKEMDEGKLETHKDYEKVNLDRTIKGLEKDVQEAGADYILVDKLQSQDMGTSWQISGKAKLLVKK